MAVRKKLSAKDASNFKSGKPVAKKKADKRAGDKLTETIGKAKKPSTEYVDPKAVSGGALRGMMEETMARVYGEMFPTMTTRDSTTDEVDLEIREEAYILQLTMVCGNDDYKPRKGLKIRDHTMKTPRYCKEHKDG